MTYRALVACTVTGLALIGCAAAPFAQTKDEPSFEQKSKTFAQEFASVLCAGACDITITVLEGCDIRVRPLTVGLPRGPSNVPIRWTIDSSSAGNAKFAAARGVYFKNANSAKEFDGERRLSDRQFVWNDKNPPLTPRARPHPYGINVVQNDRPCPTYDPTVVNDY